MTHDLQVAIRSARRRWRLRVLLHGMAWVAVGGVAAFVLSAWAVDRFRFAPGALVAFRVVAWGTVIALAVRFVVRPLLRRITDHQVALYLEEREPSLDGVLLGAVGADAGLETQTSPALLRRLLDGAMDRLTAVDGGRRVERPAIQRSGGVLAAVAALGVGAVLLGPSGVRTGLPFVVSPFRDVAASPYAIAVLPGDSTAARGADLRIRAVLQNFTADEVTLALRPRGAVDWERVVMTRDEDTGEPAFLLFDLQDTTEYFVTAAGVRSAVHRLSVVDLPYVDAIALTYRFPVYAGLEPVREEDGGDIAALVGTNVDLEITPTIATEGGALLVGTDTVVLEPDAGRLRATLAVATSGSYRVLLAGPDGRLVPASPEYFIDALDDQPPLVRLARPGRDVSVTSVDELFAEVQAEDDYGLRGVELLYSVNGGPEVVTELYGGRGRRKDVTAGHTMYLEELGLVPGDIVSYYARAYDARRDGDPSVTDIYFVTIRPFDRTWRAADQSGGQGMQGGGASPGELTERQRDIIAATFRLVRDRSSYDDREWGDNIGTVTLMQGRLREEVATLVQRIESRGVVQLDSTFAAVAEALPLAGAAMLEAEEYLGQRYADSALSPEQRALQQLQRAEAAFRERELTRGEPGQGGGGGGGEVNAEELAELFDLELDRMRNQYESVERGRRQDVQQQTDEALEKLRELARRQQQQNERRRAQEMGDPNAGGAAQGQRRLADEAEELGRRLERLARERDNPELGEAGRRLQDAANAMRRAAAGRSSGAQGDAAVEQLREAQRELEGARGAGQQRDMAEAIRRADELVAQQNEIRERLRSLPETGIGRQERLRALSERKDEMAAEVDALESELDRLARDLHAEQPEAAERLRGTVQEVRNRRLQDKIRYSRGVMTQRSQEYAEQFEQDIAGDLEAMRDGIAEAAGRMGEPTERQQERALDRARDVARALESLEERAREATESDSGVASGRRQLRSELRRRAGDLQELAEEFERQGLDGAPLGEMARRLGRADAGGGVGTPRGLTQLQEMIAALKDYEFTLRRELLGGDAAPSVLTAGDDVPAEYRSLVEEYYRRLAERRR